MRYRELLEFQEAPSPGANFYHVTTGNRLKSIMATGLDPHRRHRRWRDQVGGLQGERGITYLISDFAQAVKFAARRADNNAMQTVILVLQNVPDNGLVRDDCIESQLADNTWFKTPSLIPPNGIVRVIPLTPELIQQAIGGTLADMPPEDAVEPAG